MTDTVANIKQHTPLDNSETMRLFDVRQIVYGAIRAADNVKITDTGMSLVQTSGADFSFTWSADISFIWKGRHYALSIIERGVDIPQQQGDTP